MNTKKNRLFLLFIVLVFFTGFFFFNNQEKKSEKISLSPEEKAWLKKQGNEKIPILLPDDGSAYLYRTQEGDTEGVYHEYLAWLEKEYGLKFNILQIGNRDTSEKIDSGEAVLAYNAYRNYDRKQIYNYLKLQGKTSIVLVKKSDRDFSRENISVKKLGIVQNTCEMLDYSYTFSPRKYRKIILSSYKEGIEKLKKGEIDLLLGKSKNLMYSETEISIEEKISDIYYNLVVNKNYPQLYTILEKTLNHFHENEFQKKFIKHSTLYNTQLIQENPILEEVKKKYSKITVEILEEENYLPLYYTKGGKISGYIPTLLDNLSGIIGIPIEIVGSTSPEKKHIRAVDNNRSNPLSIPYYSWDTAVAGKKGNKYIKNYGDLIGKRVAYISNEYTDNPRTREDINFIPYKNLAESLKALERDEVDYVIGDFIFLDSAIENSYLADKITVLGFLEKSENSMAFTFSPEDKILYTLFSQIFPKDVSEYSQLKKLLVSPKQIKINYSHLGSLSAFFLVIIGIILLFLKNNMKHRKQAEKLNRDMISSFEMASAFRDEDTGNHIVRVAKYSELLAKEAGLSGSVLRDILNYASLHDIGKIGISDSILKKPGRLTLEEMAEMRKHPNIGYRLVKNAGLGKTAENIVRFHHEKWDGTGYPLRLKGNKIPLEARIVALADVYDALRQKRSYKVPYTHHEAVQIIVGDSETFFDPELIDIFLKSNEKFHEIFNKY